MAKDIHGNEVVFCTLPIPAEMHKAMKAGCEIDRRSIRQYIFLAIEERNARIMPESIDSPEFVPPGLR